MFEWLNDSIHPDVKFPVDVLVRRLAWAFVLGCVVAGIYRLTRSKRRGQSGGLVATLVLLAVLICMITLVIGSNTARAFTLVGSLAIVRFRTVVEDTRDTAFVIFAVAVGMAVGAGYREIALVSVPFAALAAVLFRPWWGEFPTNSLDYTVTVRIGAGHDPDAILRERFDKHKSRPRLVGMATARQGVAFDLTYHVRLRRLDAAMALVTELNGVEGVQGVELRQL